MALPAELVRLILDALGDDARARGCAACLARDWRRLARDSMCERWVFKGERHAGYQHAAAQLSDEAFAALARRAAGALPPGEPIATVNLQLCERVTLTGALQALREAGLAGRVSALNVLGLHTPDAVCAALANTLREVVAPGGWVDALWCLEFWGWPAVALLHCNHGQPQCDRLICAVIAGVTCLVCQAHDEQQRARQAGDDELIECYGCRQHFDQKQLSQCAGGMGAAWLAGDCAKQYCDGCAAGISKPGSAGLARCKVCDDLVCATERNDDSFEGYEEGLHVTTCSTCGASYCQECRYVEGAMRWCTPCETMWCAETCAVPHVTLGQEQYDGRCDNCVRRGVPRDDSLDDDSDD